MFVCVGSLALGIQHAQHMRRISLPSVTPWLYHIFSHYLIQGKIFEKEMNTKYFFIFPLKQFTLQQEIN